MTIRVSSQNVWDSGISNLQDRQQQMQDSQMRLTSGLRVAKPSDDPTGAAQAERAATSIGQTTAAERALNASRNSMTLAESSLGNANDLLQQIRESVLQAGDGSYTDSERLALANNISGLRAQLLAIANASNGSGGFLFSGQGSSSPPFLDTPTGVQFNGTPGTIITGNLENYQLTVDGRATWEQARSGNGSFVTTAAPNANTQLPNTSWIDNGSVTNPAQLTGHNYTITLTGTGNNISYNVVDNSTGAGVTSGPYAAGKAIQFDGLSVGINGSPSDGDQFQIAPATNSLKVFDVLDKTITDLRTPNRSTAQISQSNLSDLRDLDAVLTNIQTIRSQVGDSLNNLDNSDNRLQSLTVFSQQQQSNAQDLDMTQGISDFQNQQTGYDAALRAYASVQRLSLFQYLSTTG